MNAIKLLEESGTIYQNIHVINKKYMKMLSEKQ